MRSRFFPVFLVSLASFAWGVQACSSDAADPVDTTGNDAAANGHDATSGNDDPRDGSSSEDATSHDDAGNEDDGSSDDAGSLPDANDASTDAGCTDPVAADLNGTEACKALAFGVAALAFEASDPKGPKANGGAIPAGIYDVSRAERDTPKGSWRETLVFDGTNKFTRIRQIDTGSGNGLGPVTHASGTYATNGNEITFTTTCANGEEKDGGKTTLPYGVTADACGHTNFFFTATGLRITLKQR